VHKHIGPGQLESVYQRSMECELRRRAIEFRAQVPVPMFFKGDRVGDFFADLIVEDAVILELKAVARFQSRAHRAVAVVPARGEPPARYPHELQRGPHGPR
jgi:GxxExxY protein